MSKFSDLAKINSDHYNDHPTRHLIIVAVLGLIALNVIRNVIYRVAQSMLPNTPPARW